MHQIIPYHPFNKGVDLVSSKTFVPEGFVSLGQNVTFERGVVKQRKGYGRRSRTFSLTALTYTHATNKITGANGDFYGLVVGDSVDITGSNLTDGTYALTGIDSTDYAYIISTNIVSTNNNADTTVDTERIVSTSSLPLGEDIIGLTRFWPSDGLEKEVVITQKYAYQYEFNDGTFNSLFTSGGANVQCFAGSSPRILSTIAPLNKAGTIVPTLVFTDGYEYSSNHTLYEWDGINVYNEATAAASLTAGRITMNDTYVFASSSSFEYCRQMVWFADHLMIGDFSDNGNRYRNGVAWGGFQEMGIVDPGSGASDSGLSILSDAKGYMQRFLRLGHHLLIYFSHSIVVCDAVPNDNIYSFEVRVHGVGLIGPGAVIDVGGVHIFIGQDNVYMYDAGLMPVKIGDNVINSMLAGLNASALDAIVTHHLPRKGWIIFFLPTGGDSLSKTLYIYDYINRTWSGPGEVADYITASGYGIRNVAYKCDDPIFSGISCQGLGDARCSDFSWQADFEVPTVGSSDGDLFDFANIHLTDAGENIPSAFQTDSKPVGSPYGTVGRIIELRVDSKGSAFKLFYSKDHGESWTELPESYGGHTYFEEDRIPVNIVAEFLMLKAEFSASGSSTEIRMILARKKPSAIRSLE